MFNFYTLNPTPMKTKLGMPKKRLLLVTFLTSISIILYISGYTQVCSDPANVIYGLDANGKIYPITVSNASVGTDINITNPTGANNSNALGYASTTGKFYYYLKNPDNGNKGTFVSYDPVNNIYGNLSETNGPTENVYRASITVDGKYYCIDVNSNFYCYNISTNTWSLITSTFVDQDGNDVDAVFRAFNSGDMAFDGQGNLWFVVSGNGKIGLYKIPGPITTANISALAVVRVLSTTTSTPDGKGAYGIAFNATGQIFISTQNNLYLFNPATLAFTHKGALSNITDLTSCNFPMTVITILPLHWINFNVHANNKSQAFLNWQVSNQLDNKGFYIESSTDQSNWKELGFVASRTINNQSIEQYSFSHFMSNKAATFYRIRQQDFDGNFSYSWVRAVKIEEKDAVLISPNPAKSVINVECNSISVDQGRIFDLTGRVIQKFPLKTGNNKVDVSQLKAGVYFLSTIHDNGDVKVVRLMKE
jgi:hypothetical protein